MFGDEYLNLNLADSAPLLQFPRIEEDYKVHIFNPWTEGPCEDLRAELLKREPIPMKLEVWDETSTFFIEYSGNIGLRCTRTTNHLSKLQALNDLDSEFSNLIGVRQGLSEILDDRLCQ